MSNTQLKRVDRVLAELRAIPPELLDTVPARLRVEILETVTTLSAFDTTGTDVQLIDHAEKVCGEARVWLGKRVE
jgi:hypothetical protein